jgi:hypothetical protein
MGVAGQGHSVDLAPCGHQYKYNPGVLHSPERRTSQDRDEEAWRDGVEEARHQGIIARRQGAHSSIG